MSTKHRSSEMRRTTEFTEGWTTEPRITRGLGGGRRCWHDEPDNLVRFSLSEETYGRSPKKASLRSPGVVAMKQDVSSAHALEPSRVACPSGGALLPSRGDIPGLPPRRGVFVMEAECSAALFQERLCPVRVALCALKGTTWKGVPWEIADSVIACQVLIREGAWLSVP